MFAFTSGIKALGPAVSILLCVMAAGCTWVSDKPLIPEESSARPFAGVIHLVPMKTVDGKLVRNEKSDMVEISPDGWRYSYLEKGMSKPLAITAVKVVPDRDIFLIEVQKSRMSYSYSLGWLSERDGKRLATIATPDKEAFEGFLKSRNQNYSDFPFVAQGEKRAQIEVKSLQGLPQLFGQLFQFVDGGGVGGIPTEIHEVRQGPMPVE